MSERKDAPSGWRIEEVMQAWQAARQRILADQDVDADEAALGDLLGAEQEDADKILARLLRAAIHADDMARMAAERAEEIKGRQERYKRRSEALRTAAYHVMDAMSLTRHELPELTASVHAGTTSVFIINEDVLPEDCFRTIPAKREPDKKLIGDRLKALRDWQRDREASDAAGMDEDSVPDPPPDVPGASLSDALPGIRIRRK